MSGRGNVLGEVGPQLKVGLVGRNYFPPAQLPPVGRGSTQCRPWQILEAEGGGGSREGATHPPTHPTSPLQ